MTTNDFQNNIAGGMVSELAELLVKLVLVKPSKHVQVTTSTTITLTSGTLTILSEFSFNF